MPIPEGDFMLNTKAVSISLILTADIVYLLCAFLVYISPVGFIAYLNSWFHGVDLTLIASQRPLTVIGLLTGLITISAASLMAGALFSMIYNKLSRIHEK